MIEEVENFKFKNGDSVRIMASGVTGKVINHRHDRDDNVTTLVQWTDSNKVQHEQWCRETELGASGGAVSRDGTVDRPDVRKAG